MIKIVLEPARNGVIKKVIDDNHGGGREHFTSTKRLKSEIKELEEWKNI
jgi:hypothetical protein